MTTPSGQLLYFAYGSNMCSRRLQARVPSARAIGIGRLAQHRLRWQMPSLDGSAKCDIETTGDAAHEVWGVLFRFHSAERGTLDAAEGLGSAYTDRRVRVLTEAGAVEALVYQALRVGAGVRPYPWYRDFVLAGAREHGLPPAYQAWLATVEVMPDPDRDREAANRVILLGPG